MKWWPYYEKRFQNERYQTKIAPFSHCHAVLLHHAVSGADDDWFARDGSQEASIDFPVLYQKYLFTVVYIGRTQIHPIAPFFSKCVCVCGGDGIKGIILPAPWQDKRPVILFQKNESIGSVTKRILIGYNEAWVWLWALSGALLQTPLSASLQLSVFLLFFFFYTQCRPATTAGTEQTSCQWISQMVNPHSSSHRCVPVYIFWFMIWALPLTRLCFFFMFSNQTYSSTACLFWRCYRCHMVII